MNLFDKLCTAAAFVLGILLLVLGGVGFFFGSSAHFTLPPILGALPFFVGWGIVRPIYLAWRLPRRDPAHIPMPDRPGVLLTEDWRVNQELPCASCGYNLYRADIHSHCPECGFPVFRSIIRHENRGR